MTRKTFLAQLSLKTYIWPILEKSDLILTIKSVDDIKHVRNIESDTMHHAHHHAEDVKK